MEKENNGFENLFALYIWIYLMMENSINANRNRVGLEINIFDEYEHKKRNELFISR